MNFKQLTCVIAAISFCTSIAMGHSDILVSREGDKIVTGGYDFDLLPGDPVIPPPVRVFGYDFGEIPGQPDFAEDPGFVAVPGVFPAATSFSVHNLADLKYWDGTGGVSFGAAPNGESLLVEYGINNITIGSPGGLLNIGATTGAVVGQDLHVHIDATISGSPSVADGVYLISLSLQGSNGLIESEPFWVVYNHGADENLHDAAIEWVEQNLAPEPATALLMLMGGALLARSRRRHAQAIP